MNWSKITGLDLLISQGKWLWRRLLNIGTLCGIIATLAAGAIHATRTVFDSLFTHVIGSGFTETASALGVARTAVDNVVDVTIEGYPLTFWLDLANTWWPLHEGAAMFVSFLGLMVVCAIIRMVLSFVGID